MKKILTFLSFVVFFSSCGDKTYEEYKNITNTEADYPIIPLPSTLEIREGRFLLDEVTQIVYEGDSLHKEAEYLGELLRTASNEEVLLTNKIEEDKHSIILLLDDSLPEEGYTLEINYDRINITGKTPKGVFYGIQSLRMLLPPTAEKQAIDEITIPAVYIEDHPRYAYRGMHLDVGRHMFPVDFIKKYIDLLALHKMNRFHWHLTEDQGWRIEIKKYPKLTEVGSVRKETMIEKNFDPYKGDKKEYGGYYTQEEVKEIVAYAQDKHIVIIPEIEMPGHALAALASYPELGNDTAPYEVATKWGVFEQIYAPKEETFAFLEDVLTEVMALFPSKYIHIGGDEAPKKEWEESEQAQAVIKREGLKDEHELQSYFIQRIEKFLNSHGRQIIGWDEILEGGLAPNATVMSWRGMQGGIEAANQGHDVIMTPGTHMYFDHYQADPESEPLAIGGFTPVKKVYSFEPTPDTLAAKKKKYILGAQGNVWTEYMKTSDHVEYMVLPRMSALAEVVWSAREKRNWEDFKKRLFKLEERYKALGYNYAEHVFNDPKQENNTQEKSDQ